MKLILSLLVGLAVLSSCGPTTKRLAGHGLATAFDCGSAEAQKQVKQYEPAFASLFQHATTNTGELDLPTLDAGTKALEDIGWCVVEKTAADIIAQIAIPGAPQSEETRASDAQVRSAVLELRNRYHAGKSFVVDGHPLVEAQ